MRWERRFFLTGSGPRSRQPPGRIRVPLVPMEGVEAKQDVFNVCVNMRQDRMNIGVSRALVKKSNRRKRGRKMRESARFVSQHCHNNSEQHRRASLPETKQASLDGDV